MATENTPPEKTVKVSEAEVIDPHFRVTFPLPDGWGSWTEDNRKKIIENLKVKLTYDSKPQITFGRKYEADDFKAVSLPIDLSKFDDKSNYYENTDHYLTLYIGFPDPDFDTHDQKKWEVTIKFKDKTIEGYEGKIIPFQSKRTS